MTATRPTTHVTGGQWSLLRVALALGIALIVGRDAIGTLQATQQLQPGQLAALALTIPLALGWRANYAAVALIVIAGATHDIDPILVVPLLCHFAAHVGPKPFGSLDALGRLDPGGGWEAPHGLLTWGRLVVAGLALLIGSQAGPMAAYAAWAALYVAGSTIPRLRPIAALAWIVGLAALPYLPPSLAPALGLTLFVLADPRWIPPRLYPGEDERAIHVFYDKGCGLCHRSVRFLLAEDQDARLVFAPLRGDAWDALLTPHQRNAAPDSMVTRLPDGRVTWRSKGILPVMDALGGLWRAIALVGRLVPGFVLDGIYMVIAATRYRLFPKPEDVCPIMPPDLRPRFRG